MALGWTVYEALGSILVGGVIGWILSQLEARVDDQAELLMVIVAGVLVAIGTAITLRISPLLAAMAVGAMTTNLSIMHRLAYAELRQTEQPLYIAFFVLSGAKLDIHSFGALGALGIIYIVARGGGKYLGTWLAARHLKITGPIRTHLGLALMPQAGVAIGLMRLAESRYSHIGEMISAVILAAVIVYETLGPLVTRWAIFAAHENSEVT
jgi:Kef-type K+ transport system membrane component KefB